ncbi:reverse transcriptase domain-containing protein [Tanacetum coccineum]
MLTNLTMQNQNPSGSGSLPSNTIANPRGDVKSITTRSGVAYDGPTILPTLSPLPKEVECETEAKKDKMQSTSSESTAHVQPLVVQLDECLALADLGASINLMPLSVWKKLSLPELTPTRMTLELADQPVAYPKGLEFLSLGRPFLRTAQTLIDVHGEELTLRVNDEAITFKVGHTSRYYFHTINMIIGSTVEIHSFRPNHCFFFPRVPMRSCLKRGVDVSFWKKAARGGGGQSRSLTPSVVQRAALGSLRRDVAWTIHYIG